MSDRTTAWTETVIARHTGGFTTSEFLKAVRALSARYVERRGELPRRSPIDSAGKRAAFAGYFAPLHFLTTRAIVQAIAALSPQMSRIVDLGCGTGAASAAWAIAAGGRPEILGVDQDAWALEEAAWNWRQLGLHGRTRRADLVAAASELGRGRRTDADRMAVLLAWSVNELDAANRRALLPPLLAAHAAGVSILIIEPLARAAVPWWDEWTNAWKGPGVRADEWKFDVPLPPALDRLRQGAGFSRQHLGARSFWAPSGSRPRATID